MLDTGTTRKAVSAIAVMMMLALPILGQDWTDRSEYDLVLAIRAEADPAKKLIILDQWKDKYPKTKLRKARWGELYLTAYQSLGSLDRMLDVAGEMAADTPPNLMGLYWFTLLTPGAKEPSPVLMGRAEKAAQQLLTGLGMYFGQTETVRNYRKRLGAAAKPRRMYSPPDIGMG